MGNPQFLTISSGESSYFLSTNCQKGSGNKHLNWGYCIYLTFLDALKWGNGENDQPLDLGVPSISWPKMRQLHDPKLSPPWRLDSRFDIWALRWMKNKKDLFRKFTHPFADLFLIAFSDQLLVIRTFAWPGEVARIACCSRRCADCQWNVRPHEFGTKSPCVILMLDGVDQTGWKCWILQELHYCSMNNRSEEALWWNKPAPNLVLGFLPKLLLHFGKETVLIDADSFYESLTFADANSKWECDFIWSS